MLEGYYQVSVSSFVNLRSIRWKHDADEPMAGEKAHPKFSFLFNETLDSKRERKRERPYLLNRWSMGDDRQLIKREDIVKDSRDKSLKTNFVKIFLLVVQGDKYTGVTKSRRTESLQVMLFQSPVKINNQYVLRRSGSVRLTIANKF